MTGHLGEMSSCGSKGNPLFEAQIMVELTKCGAAKIDKKPSR